MSFDFLCVLRNKWAGNRYAHVSVLDFRGSNAKKKRIILLCSVELLCIYRIVTEKTFWICVHFLYY